ncbi:ferrous iron transport protein B [Lactococcus cremoris]|jgi:ferrous iron transport protein B|uniref:Ferrous iron transport protein B n=1 Tax=Lactococcus lactis subsp. cremoris (strain MG1363) TaxID=416870 RepID=A2RHR8_LACLM|nr:ferrous iron transport protein B [Lactococcus cremoris]ADJ59224.1 ferrous iron transport protein B-like protein [Lactococcus cremoris subsp. cremoris NZ9000]KZK52369.1 Ferrous iron transport protein B [Lactococcus cremoris]MCT4434989.1 ferrous iron transport protein B [Lactococcus cremoris]MCT4445706.1 ferrous iron transport protein B [Lactococcus cremoris]MCZ7688045.1 ferrous iron transport protein B [Lactococcus cremoris]
MKIIALLGNPNSGKTSIFNLLTGSNQQVGNWPGVTVEKKSGIYRKDKNVCIQDLPGLYSLSPYSLDEQVARDFLVKTPPDALINIVDSTNLERSLYLTLQLMEFGIPMVLALNMSDLLENQGKKIDLEKLSYSLGIPVITTSAIKNKGLDEVVKAALRSPEVQPLDYDHRLEGALSEISKVTGFTNRFEQIKVFEGDQLLLTKLSAEQLDEVEEIVSITEKLMTDDRESIIVNERYDLIGHFVQLSVSQTETGKVNLTDRIDQIITHKWLGLPIFVFIMWLVYFISIQTVGTAATDWLNDVFFGQWLPDLIANGMNALAVTPWVQDLVLNGVVAGIGAILGFVPQIFVLFLLLGILEDSGYMARVAFVMDHIFRRFGLSGKSFIPMLIASGCGVPGIMATRTIEQERDRKITIMVTTFMPCSAKLPIIALVSGAFFPHASWVAPSAYFLGMSMIILSGIILKKTRMFSGDTSAFIMELPTYHLPYALTVLKYAFDRAFSFVKRAGTIIFAMNVLIWFTSNYNWTLAHVDASQSILADIGKVVAVIFAPLGFGEWRATVATITGLIAKETIVGTMGVLFAHNSSDSHQLWSAVQATYTPLSAYSLLVFNLLCAPCVAAISTIYKEMGDVRWTLRAVGFQTLVAYSMSFIIYQLGSFFSSQNFDVLSLVALLVLLVGLYFIFRKGKDVSYELS